MSDPEERPIQTSKDPRRKPVVKTFDQNRGGADQSQRELTNINSIVRSFGATGAQPALNPAEGHFGDFSDPVDLQTAFERVWAAQSAFSDLPAPVRQLAGNDPMLFAELLMDPANIPALEDAGLVLPGGKWDPSLKAPPQAEPSPAAQPDAEAATPPEED